MYVCIEASIHATYLVTAGEVHDALHDGWRAVVREEGCPPRPPEACWRGGGPGSLEVMKI